MSESRASYVLSRAPRRYLGGRKGGGSTGDGSEGDGKDGGKGNGRTLSAAEAGFPGCKARPMTAAQLADEEDGPRFEYWDAEGGIAWTVEEGATIVHEYPVQRLTALLERIAEARGAALACGGAMTFFERAPTGEHIRAMEADQTVYLDEARARALPSPTLVLGADPPPDIVVEVDHTTDVRRRKLDEYQRWRFPEVWVEVPEPWHGKRSGHRAGTTIHVLEGSGKLARYREAPASLALPGWSAEEIHLALNEPQRSAATRAAVERVGRALRKQERARPAEGPIARHLLADAGSAARRAGRRGGRAEGEAEGTAATVRQLLAERTVLRSPDLLVDATRHSRRQLVAAALACRSEADFHARLEAARGGEQRAQAQGFVPKDRQCGGSRRRHRSR